MSFLSFLSWQVCLAGWVSKVKRGSLGVSPLGAGVRPGRSTRPPSRSWALQVAEGEPWGGWLGPGWLLHLVTFLGKKLRSSPWSQRRTERDRREHLGGCGYTRHSLAFFRTGTAGGKEGEADLDGAAAGSSKHSSVWPAAAIAPSGFPWQQGSCPREGARRLAPRGGASVSKLAL